MSDAPMVQQPNDKHESGFVAVRVPGGKTRVQFFSEPKAGDEIAEMARELRAGSQPSD